MSEELQEQSIRGIVSSFVKSYREKTPKKTDVSWLDEKFAEYPELWKDEAERRAQAGQVVDGVRDFRASSRRLETYGAEGKSASRFLEDSIRQGCAAGGVAVTSQYVAGIDSAIDGANRQMAEIVFVHKPDGTLDFTSVNQCPHLNGNIAEAHHAGTFNVDAATKESSLHAEMPTSHGRNSVDILVKDANGHVVRRYQSKYGKDAKTTEAMFGANYRGQRKLVPAGQADKIPDSTDHMEADGVKSDPLSKDDAVEKQKETQTSGKAPELDWRNANAGVVMKRIGTKAAIAGALAVGFQGARIVGRRLWNAVTGKGNQSVEEDLKEFAESAVKSGAGAAGMVAVAGGLTVAARKGLLGAAMKSVRGNVIANVACMAVENVKILGKLGRGEVTGAEALDLAGRANTALVGSLALGAKGAALGATIGTALGPIGAVVGGFVGGVVGGIAGSVAGEAVYTGAKAIVKTVAKMGCKIARGIGSCVRAVGRGICKLASKLNPFNW